MLGGRQQSWARPASPVCSISTCSSLIFELRNNTANTVLRTEKQGVQDFSPQTGLSSSAPTMKPHSVRLSLLFASYGGAFDKREKSRPRPQSLATSRTSAVTRSTLSSAVPIQSPDNFVSLHNEVPFDVANVEVRWAGLTHELVRDSLRRLMEEVMPLLVYERHRSSTLTLTTRNALKIMVEVSSLKLITQYCVLLQKWLGSQGMNKPSGRRQRKKDKTRQTIAEAAMRLFLENSFDKVTIAQIAEAADVSVNTVFNYFPTKEDLFFASHPGSESVLAGLAMAREPYETVIAFLRRLLDEDIERYAKTPVSLAEIAYLTALRRVLEESPGLQVHAAQIGSNSNP